MRNRKGFTLIELLIVVVIIGILAAIALPKFATARERAYYSAIKSDLKSLAGAQEIYYSKNLRYTNSTSALGFTSSQGVNLGTITVEGGGDGFQGWKASATHNALSLATNGCAIYSGATSAPTAPATPNKNGVPACDE
jgi:type IV pilus assembly protein PilA